MTLAVGFFDGVHLGHQAILKGADVALTFKEHPLAVLDPSRPPRLMMTCAERLAVLRACGVKRVEALDFTRDFARLSPEDFLARLASHAGGEPIRIRCGANWRFGAGGRGDAALCTACGIPATVVPYALYKGERVSSTRIRRALEAGELEDARAMLGRPYAVTGEVFSGKALGRAMGYATVNLHLPFLALNLPHGVYVVEAAGTRGVANFGVAPTLGEKAWASPELEIHFLSEPPPHVSRVSLLRFLRPERKFASLAALQAQIAKDCAAAQGV